MTLDVRKKLFLTAALSLLALIGLCAFALNLLFQTMVQDRIVGLRHVTSLGLSVAETFYAREQSGELTAAEAQQAAAAVIGKLKYSADSYLFVNNSRAVRVVFPPNPKAVGQNTWNVVNPQGIYLNRVMAQRAVAGNPAPLFYTFPKPGQSVNLWKVAVVRYFAPWDWVIGTGVYLDDVHRDFIAQLWEFASFTLPILLVICGVALWVSRSIALPMRALADQTNRLVEGDLSVAVTGTKRRDEIGVLAAAIHAFKTAALEKRALEAEAAETRRIADGARAQAEAAKAETTANLASVVEAFAGALAKLAQGDLTQRIDRPLSADYETLRHNFNAAIDQLHALISDVAANTDAIRIESGQIARASDDLARRTEQQAASLEETSAALNQVTTTVKQTAAGAGEAQSVVKTARLDAERSGEVVASAMAAMDGISRSSGQISQIIGVIEEIAFQTNLLALNAGVEAARAGDAGRGFAVVASEVRALAQRSADAAKEITQLIRNAEDQVKSGVGLVADASKALTRIASQVSDINGIVTTIAASARDQSASLDEVNVAVNQMDRATQQSAAMVEESTAAAAGLAHTAATLSSRIKRFKLAATTVTASATRPRVMVQAQESVPV